MSAATWGHFGSGGLWLDSACHFQRPAIPAKSQTLLVPSSNASLCRTHPSSRDDVGRCKADVTEAGRRVLGGTVRLPRGWPAQALRSPFRPPDNPDCYAVTDRQGGRVCTVETLDRRGISLHPGQVGPELITLHKMAGDFLTLSERARDFLTLPERARDFITLLRMAGDFITLLRLNSLLLRSAHNLKHMNC